MAYIYDNDLEFLRNMKSEDLNDLVEVLTIDKDGKERYTQSLTKHGLYRKYYPNHKEYLDLILEEFQAFGGNSIMNKIRSKGVKYKEILCDVCKKMKVNFNKNSNTERIENAMLMKLFEDAIEKMSPEELKEVVETMDLKTTSFTAQAVLIALQTKTGFITSYALAYSVASAVTYIIYGHALKYAGAMTLGRFWGVFFGPIGLTFSTIWTAISIAGPAYRVTIPAVIQIAYLRQLSYQEKSETKENEDSKIAK